MRISALLRKFQSLDEQPALAGFSLGLPTLAHCRDYAHFGHVTGRQQLRLQEKGQTRDMGLVLTGSERIAQQFFLHLFGRCQKMSKPVYWPMFNN